MLTNFYIIPNSPSFSAISSEFLSKLALYLFHRSSSHTSNLLNRPATTTDLLKKAYFFKTSGINIRPSESNSTSTAPDRNKRLKDLVSFLAMESHANISANGFQDCKGKTNKQLSSPLVSTAPSPSSFLNFEGIDNLFFGSRLCLYSPISMLIEGPRSRPRGFPSFQFPYAPEMESWDTRRR